MLLLFEAPIKREKVNTEINGLEVIYTLRRARELRLITPFIAWQFIMRRLVGKVYCIYAVIRNDKCVHASHVIGKGWRFPFMAKDDIEIGPSWTAPEFRNQGLFTTTLSSILHDFKEKRAWIFSDEANAASIRGIKKAGFRLI